MKQFLLEVDAAFDRFGATWRRELRRADDALSSSHQQYLESYRRLASLQAWKSILLENRITRDSLGFFLEAQNDGLVSHVFAALGSWRSALKSLRSCIENVCLCLYYMDHPIELELWHQGKHSLNFAAIMEYLGRHPALNSVRQSVNGLEILKKEYTILSRAVHGSAVGFRMSADDIGVRLWLSDQASLGAWATREAHTLCGINLVLLATFRNDLQGARLMDLRRAVSLAIPGSKHKDIKQFLKITLMRP